MPPLSVLSDGQKRFLLVILTLTILILANSAYLFITTPHETGVMLDEKRYEISVYGMVGTEPVRGTSADDHSRDLSKFYQSMLLSHIVGGLTLMGAVIVFIVWHLRNALQRNNRKAVAYGSILAVTCVLISVSGLFILTEANSTQNRWIFYSHRVLAILIPLIYVVHRLAASTPLTPAKLVRGFGSVAAIWLALLVAHYVSLPDKKIEYGQLISSLGVDPEDVDGEFHDPFIPFQPTNLGPPDSRFKPSAVTTTSGELINHRVITQDDVSNPALIDADIETYGFVVNDSMGSATCARCHAGIVEQWSKSTHRFSSFNNPFYKASVDNLRDEEHGKQRSQWCGACHDPALMFQGKMLEEVDPHWPESQAGLTCLSCHAIDEIHGKEGNGNYNISDEKPSPYLFADAKSGPQRLFNDMLIKAKPAVHKNRMLKPFYRSSEYCLTCHKVSLDIPINNYRWVRGQNEYDAWHDSGVALNASRTFYLPPKKRVCQDCHMAPEPVMLPDVSAKKGLVKSHRFLAANTALPYIRGDQETLKRIEEYLQDEKMRVDIFAVRKEPGINPVVLNKGSRVSVEPGEVIQVDVVVRNLGVGHTFPGGTNDSNEGWIEFSVQDDNGRKYYHSGGVGEDGHVDSNAHMYKVIFVDEDSKAVMHRDPQNFRAVVYARMIGPGTADVVRYRFKVPEELESKEIVISASLMWRKFNRTFTEFVFNRERLPDLEHLEGKKIPDLPVTQITSDSKSLIVGEEGESVQIAKTDWIRMNDYGIAHFLQNDFQTASWAWEQVAELVPEKPDGPRNLARVAVMEGRIEEAYRYLEKTEEITNGDPQTAWFWGLAKQDDGLYDEAVKAFERVLAYFPEDRATWRQLGRTYYLDGQYEKALEAYLQVLKIDPEDSGAHYHRMLCYRALGDEEAAAEAESAYSKYQIDESANAYTQRFRLENPTVNLQSQKIHVYEPTAVQPSISSR